MSKLITLVRVQLINLFSSGSGSKKRSLAKAGSIGGVVYVFVLLAVVFGFYAVTYAGLLNEVGQALYVMPLMLYMATLMIIIFTFSKVKDVLLDFKDYDLLMSLPIPRWMVLASRLLLMLVANLVYALAVLLPAGVVAAIYCRPGAWYYFVFVITLLPAGLLPVVLSAVVGAVISAATAKLKHQKAASTALMLLFPILIMVMSFSLSSASSRGGTAMAQTFQNLTNSLFYVRWYYEALDGSVLSLIYFLAVNILPAALFCLIFSKYFQRLHAASRATYQGEAFRMTSLGVSTPFRALLEREWRMYINTTAYFINTIFGPVLMVLGVAALCIFYGRFSAQAELAGLLELLPPMLPAGLGTLVMMSSTTDSAISIEGKRYWLLKSLPVPVKTILNVKLLLCLLITEPACLACGAVLAVRMQTSPVVTLLLFITPLVFCLFTAVLGLVLNLHFPKLDWTNETVVVKQSMPVFVCAIGGMVFGMGACAVSAIFGSTGCALVTLGVFLVTAVLYLHLVKRGPALFRAIG